MTRGVFRNIFSTSRFASRKNEECARLTPPSCGVCGRLVNKKREERCGACNIELINDILRKNNFLQE